MLVGHSSRPAAVLRLIGFVVSLVAVALIAAVHAKRAHGYASPTAWQLKHHRVLENERSVVRVALKQRGIPYRWGGSSRAGFDCSGLVLYSYRTIGISLPHYNVSLFQFGRAVHGRFKPGDLLFFHGLSHVGMYIGHGLFVHAPHTGTRVSVASLASYSGFDGARRLIH
jgi:cell wall-associated NlpC family hydrolase